MRWKRENSLQELMLWIIKTKGEEKNMKEIYAMDCEKTREGKNINEIMRLFFDDQCMFNSISRHAFLYLFELDCQVSETTILFSDLLRKRRREILGRRAQT